MLGTASSTHVPCGLGRIDGEGNLLGSDRSLACLLGGPSAEPLALLSSVHADDRILVQQLLRSAAPEEEVRVRLWRDDGRLQEAALRIHQVEGVGPLLHVRALDPDSASLEEQLTWARAEVAALRLRVSSIREDERRRIARELHDHLGQRLTALHLEVASLRERELSPEVEAALGVIGDGLVELLCCARDVSVLLHAATVQELGLEGAVRFLVHDVQERGRVSCELQFAIGELEPDAARDLTLFRVLQEALTNAVRHAGAGRIQVSLAVADDEVRLTVEDDGRGFETDPGRGRPAHGLLWMMERMVEIGGRLAIDSHPGSGTRVRAQAPLRRSRGPT